MKHSCSFWTAAVLFLATATTRTRAADDSSDEHRELQSSTPRVIADAYECDEYLQILPEAQRKAFKPLGYEIRVCVRPNTPTRNRGIVMRTIDEFTWFKSFGATVQPAITNKADLSQTLQVCIPGRQICSFKTTLLDDFFYGETNGTVVGTGQASMQVANSDANPTIRRQLGADENGIFQAAIQWTMGGQQQRELQVGSALGGFVGQSGIKLEFNVDARPPPDNYVPFVEEDISTWWEDSPTWLKVLIIAGACVLLLMGCCLCFMCMWSIRECLRDEVEKDKAKELDEQQANPEQAPEGGGVHINPPAGAGNSAWEQCDPDATEAEDEAANQGDPSLQPTDKDVCFDADEHPGTKAMHVAVKKTLKKYPTVAYSPVQYRHIKKQLPGRKCFVCDDEDHPDVWREVPKSELVELLKKEFEDLQQQQQQATETLVVS
jgi:hypothetical protein